MKNSPVVGIYLAAGNSSRMGKNKLQLPLDETCLGSKCFKSALESKLDWTVAITRRDDPLHWLEPYCAKRGWSMMQLQSLQADRGQSESIKAGVRAAMSLNASGVVILLADQPLVTSRIINLLLRQNSADFVASVQKGVITPPVFFSQKLFPKLLLLNGDAGARALLQGNEGEKGMFVEIEGDFLIDIDTEKEYQKLLTDWRERAWMSSEKV